jgi:hypothetical protein
VTFSQTVYDRLIQRRRRHERELAVAHEMGLALEAMSDRMSTDGERFLDVDDLMACLRSEVGEAGVERFRAIRSGHRRAAA